MTCNCGADRTGPSAEAHLPSCPEAKPEQCPTCMSTFKSVRLQVRCPEFSGGQITTRILMEMYNHSWHGDSVKRRRERYDVASDIIGLFLEYRDKHGKTEKEAAHCAATEYEESEDLTQ